MARGITRLSAADWRYLTIAVYELALARVRHACEPAQAIVTRLNEASQDSGPVSPSSAASADIARMAWAIAAAASRVPWRSDCLLQVMAAARWLRRHDIPSTFRLGVAKDPDGTFRAHAWLTCAGQPVAGGDGAEFVPLIEPPQPDARKARH